MKTIESKEDMISWAKTINMGVTIKQKCDLQDVWAHSNPDKLKTMFMELNGERRLVLSGVYNTMSYEAVEELLLHYAKTKGNKSVNDEIEREMTEINKMRSDIFKRENSLQDCLKGYWKRISDLRRSNDELKRRDTMRMETIANLQAQLRYARNEALEYKARADKYDRIKSALT